MTTQKILTNDDLRQQIPSAYTDSAKWLTPKYKSISTETIVDGMRERGWNPVIAKQTGTRAEGDAKKHYNFHMIHFRNEEHTERMMTQVGDSIPEMVLINSNNGSRAFRFEAGIFRLVCSNGMIIKEADFGSIRQVHMGEFDLNPHIDQFVKNTLKTTNKVLQLQGVDLDIETQRELAQRAMDIRFGGAKFQPVIDDVLKVRRSGDQGNNGWVVTNRVQEALIRGGVQTQYHCLESGDTVYREAGEVKNLRMVNQYNDKLFEVVNDVVLA